MTNIDSWADELEKLKKIKELIINLYSPFQSTKVDICTYVGLDDLFNSVSTLTQLKRFEIPFMFCDGRHTGGDCSG